MIPQSWICFRCGRPVNQDTSGTVARIWHHTTSVEPRESVRAFHDACFAKFDREGGRPWNPQTRYEVLEAQDVRTGSDVPHRHRAVSV